MPPTVRVGAGVPITVREKFLLAGDAEGPPGRPGGEDDRPGLICLLTDPHGLDVAAEVDAGDVVGDELGAEAVGLLAQVVHQVGAGNAVGEAGEVLHLGGGHQCTAGLAALNEQRCEVGAGGVEGGGVSGGSGTDDCQAARIGQEGLLLRDSRPPTAGSAGGGW